MLHHFNWIVTCRCTQKILSFSPLLEYLLTMVEINEIKEYPHHFEFQVINCSNFYNQDDHKNSVVNSLDLIEEIQHNYVT